MSGYNNVAIGGYQVGMNLTGNYNSALGGYQAGSSML